MSLRYSDPGIDSTSIRLKSLQRQVALLIFHSRSIYSKRAVGDEGLTVKSWTFMALSNVCIHLSLSNYTALFVKDATNQIATRLTRL